MKKLPSIAQCRKALNKNKATSLQNFIFNFQYTDDYGRKLFRKQLKLVLLEHYNTVSDEIKEKIVDELKYSTNTSAIKKVQKIINNIKK
jgi:hypothetical protein